ncbi:MAG: N-acetyltransferase [Gammaproteobacteria bacterium]|nr:N-acetyltransferase [Gammaproteobacteria bacterium]NNJ83475.1 N-acetyltransferase [Gammaproteobacteria bacterium]
MIIRTALASDIDDVLSVERAAFGSDAEANLVHDLLGDASAKPAVSLLAFEEDRAIGHILFTKAYLEPLSIYILAPLAVVPDRQKQGVGGKLIKHGLRILSESGVELVFVLGHPGYYPRHGFKPVGVLGFDAPYPIPEKDADAWMIQALRQGIVGTFRGKVMCAEALKKPEYWRE